MQAAGVHKMRVCKPQRRGLFVHHGDERFLASGHGLCQRLRRLRAGGDDRAVQQIAHRDRLAVHIARHRRARKIQRIDNGLRHGECRVEIRQILRRHQQRHDLRHGRGINFLVHALFGQHRPALHVDQHGGRRIQLQIERSGILRRLRQRQGRLLRFGLRLRLRLRFGFGQRFRFRLLHRLLRDGGLRLRGRIRLAARDRRIEIGLYDLPVRVIDCAAQQCRAHKKRQRDAEHPAAFCAPAVAQAFERGCVFRVKLLL